MLPKTEFNAILANHLVSGQLQHSQKVLVYVEKNAIQRNNAATHGTVTKDGGKALLGLAQGHLGLLALRDVDRRAFQYLAPFRVSRDGSPFERPKNASIFFTLPGFIVDHLPLFVQMLQESVAVPLLHVQDGGGVGL